MQKILLTALIAGFIAGLVNFGIQQVKLLPLILQAETYEKPDSSERHHDIESWSPTNGFERNVYHAITNIGIGVGYALILIGAFVLRNDKINAKTGMLWGIAGFAVFSLAPTFGLAPKLPGSIEADLTASQIWWLATVCTTAGGLAIIFFSKHTLLKILAIALLISPHIIGAPAPTSIGGTVPPELNAAFAAASLGVSAIFWLTLGTISGWFYGKNPIPETVQPQPQ